MDIGQTSLDLIIHTHLLDKGMCTPHYHLHYMLFSISLYLFVIIIIIALTHNHSLYSVSTRTSNAAVAVVPSQLNIEELKCPEVEIHSLVLFDQTTFDGTFSL